MWKGLLVNDPAFRFIDLFAGIGGLRRGFDALGGQCVFTCEWDKYAQKTYAENYDDGPDHIMAGDIRDVVPRNIPDYDLLLAGFPCQPFSIAGISKKRAIGQPTGFRCETQGTLFFEVERIIEYHRPRAFALENVKNLLNHDRGRTFRIIRANLEKLDYCISHKVIDAKRFVPQHRERIFIVGFRREDSVDVNLDDLELPDLHHGPKLRTILHPEDGSEKKDKPYTNYGGKVSKRYTLSDHLWNYLQDYAEKHRERGNGFGFGLVGPDDVARTLSARYYKDGSEILIARGEDQNPRRLTPRECSRLMGFDAPGRSDFVIPVSDTQAYKQFGNAVVAPVAEAVARHVVPHLVREPVAVG